MSDWLAYGPKGRQHLTRIYSTTADLKPPRSALCDSLPLMWSRNWWADATAPKCKLCLKIEAQQKGGE